MKPKLSLLMLIISVTLPIKSRALEPLYLKCSGSLHNSNMYFDNSAKSSAEYIHDETISMTIEDEKVRFDGGLGSSYILLLPKKEFSICNTNEILYFDTLNDQDCKSGNVNNSSLMYTDLFSGEYNRILKTLVLNRARNTYSIKDSQKINTKSISTAGEFSCSRVHLK